MSDLDVVSEGRAAWQRIQDTKPLYDDWLAIGKALVVGKAWCLRQAGTNGPYGPSYMRHTREWLIAAGLSDVETQERRGAIFMAEHEAELVRWRSSLSPDEVRHCNHPSTVVKHFRAGTRPQPRGPKRQQHHVVEHRRTDATTGQYGPRPTRPDGDLIRRVATALRTCGKADWFALAIVAIEALTVEDLRNLMPAKLAPKIVPAPAMELHA